MSGIRPCRDDERTVIFEIVNAAAEAYRGVIPADRWREPYMSFRELEREIAAGVAFWGHEAGGSLVGIMGIQPLSEVDLIRHAYVLPGSQRLGVGSSMLEHLRNLGTRRMLVGTVGGCRLGDPLLPEPRLRTGLVRAQDCAAQELLDHPGPPDRNLGRARQPSARSRLRGGSRRLIARACRDSRDAGARSGRRFG